MRPVPSVGQATQEGGGIFCVLRSANNKKIPNWLNTNHELVVHFYLITK
jgi:hypothetical protein